LIISDMQKELLHFKEQGTGPSLIILHGLLGSLDNWQGLAKKFADRFRVITPDLRNHGRSFHHPVHDYNHMAEDIISLMNFLNIDKSHVIGHSMGGKLAMELALNYPERVSGLIVSDIAPVAYDDRHQEVFAALKSAPLGSSDRDMIAEHLMNKLGNQKSTVLFLMKSLMRDIVGQGFQWRFNLDSLFRQYSAISAGIVSDFSYQSSVLFIKGENSDYISAETYPSIASLFPNHEIEEIRRAGHWIHADQPELFFEVCMSFLLR